MRFSCAALEAGLAAQLVEQVVAAASAKVLAGKVRRQFICNPESGLRTSGFC